MNRRNAIQIIVIILAILMIGVGIFGFLTLYQNHELALQIVTLESQLKTLQGNELAFASSTGQAVAQIASAQKTNVPNPVIAAAKSQDQLLTSAVAKTAPSVVSIVISQYAPQYEIKYENPFGDDPRYQGLGIRIPVYEQTSTELQKVGAGTGILFTHDGYIVTNKHVIFDQNAQYSVLLSDGSQKIAQVIYSDPNNDIAIVKIPGTYQNIATFGDSGELKLGQTVTTIGNALGEYNNSVSVGIISGLNRTITASDENGNLETLQNVIQTDAAINPGNSGGPLIDLNGDVVGINVATDQGGSSIGFSIPINSIKNTISKYK